MTQGMLSRFLVCRERFRLRVVEGLRPAPMFQHRIEYGQMWHTCEEYHAQGQAWEGALKLHAQDLCRLYPTQQEQIQHWYNVCKVQFPVYVKYWGKHPDVKSRTPLLQEQVFDVPYNLPSGRIVRLRGKWDAVDVIGKGKNAAVYLQENKTKGDIDELQLKRQLQFDLQTMLYLVALEQYARHGVPMQFAENRPVAGVRYNVVRRPLSGWRHSIRQTQKETPAEFYARLGGLIEEEPAFFFMRWKVEVTPGDMRAFEHRCLVPLLESLCDWWSWIDSPAGRKDPFGDHVHWQTPYGFYNVMAEGGSTELDEFLATRSELGLVRNAPLFTELQ